MIQPSDTGVSRLHTPIEADDRGLRAPLCQLVDRPPGTRQVAEPRGALSYRRRAGPVEGHREPSGTSRLTGIIGVRKRRRCPAADDRRCLMYQLVVLQGRHHEQGEVHPPGDVARQDGVAHVPAPHRKALALAFFELAAAHDGPPRIAGEHASAGFNLVIEVDRPDELAEPAQDSAPALAAAAALTCPARTAAGPLPIGDGA